MKDAIQQPVAASAATPSAADVPALLEKLHELLTKGILTQEEFDAKKAELTGLPASVRYYVRRSDKDGAFAKLERKFAERNPTMPFLKVSRGFDPLRSDPRYADLLRRMALK